MKKTIVIVISILVTFFLLISCEKEEKEATVESQNSYATNFSLLKLDGSQKVELNDYKGKPMVINFWASWCVPCRKEMPFLEKMWQEYKDKGLAIMGIDMLDDKGHAKEFLDQVGISYINLYDPSGQVGNTYGAVSLPTTFFIDKEGRIIRKSFGGFLDDKDEKRFIDYVEELIK